MLRQTQERERWGLLSWPLLRDTLWWSEASARSMNEMEYVQRKLVKEGDALNEKYGYSKINMCVFIFWLQKKTTISPTLQNYIKAIFSFLAWSFMSPHSLACSKESLDDFEKWAAHDSFCYIDGDDSEGSEYVDLLLNPERYTGYAGPSAHRIWRSIYQENCFKWVIEDLCLC